MSISQNLRAISSLFDSRGYKDNDQVDPANSNITLKQLKTICSIPLWWTDKEVHQKMAEKYPEACCFHHYLGLEQKYGEYKVPHPAIIECIKMWGEHKASVLWKFGGFAATTTGEFYLPHQAIASNAINMLNSKIGIVVGPRMTLASEMLDSVRDKFRRKQGIEFKGTQSKIKFPPPNRVTLEIYPSNVHISAIRGQKNMSIMWFDECDHISKTQIRQMLDALERYILKSRARIIMVSTPNKPDHMLDRIQREYSHLYHIVKYTIWDGGIPWCYTMEEAQAMKDWPSFPREYECKFLGNEGNVFARADIERAYNLGLKHCRLAQQVAHFYPDRLEDKILEDPAIMQYLSPEINMPVFPKGIGVDPAGGSSDFAIVITAKRDFGIDVIYAKKFRRASPTVMLRLMKDLATIYRGNKIHIDGNAAGTVTDLKREFHEDNRENLYKNLTTFRDRDIQRNKIIPVNFSTMHRLLLQHTHGLISKGLVRIHPIFRDLRIALESATAVEWDLDKDETVYDDLLDALSLSLLAHSIGIKQDTNPDLSTLS